MKVLFIAELYPPILNGASYATKNLIHALAQKGHDVVVVGPSDNLRYHKRKEEGISVHRLPAILLDKKHAFRASPSLFLKSLISEIIAIEKPDIIHTNSAGWVAQSVQPIAKAKGISMIGTSHILPENFLPHISNLKLLEKALTKGVWKWFIGFYNKLDAMTAPTQTAVDILTDHGLKTPVYAVSNGIDIRKYKTHKHHSSATKTILFVGRLDQEKHVDVLMRAIALLPKNSDIHVKIVGIGSEEKSLKSLSEQLGIAPLVSFLGFISDNDLYTFYSDADIFVMPGTAELQSLVTMEAMASGLPIVAANACALPHLVQHEKNGYIFEPGNEKELAMYLQILITKKTIRTRFGEKSQERITEHSMHHVVEQIEKLYAEYTL